MATGKPSPGCVFVETDRAAGLFSLPKMDVEKFSY
jgi:hypothetical protein